MNHLKSQKRTLIFCYQNVEVTTVRDLHRPIEAVVVLKAIKEKRPKKEIPKSGNLTGFKKAKLKSKK